MFHGVGDVSNAGKDVVNRGGTGHGCFCWQPCEGITDALGLCFGGPHHVASI